MADERPRHGGGEARLSPAELARRLERFLAHAEHLINAVPDPYAEHRVPGQELTIRDLAYRVFRAGLAFADGMDMGRLPAEWLAEAAPPELADAGGVARYGALVRGRLGGWIEGASAPEYARIIAAGDVAQTGHDVLEHVTALVADRLRRLAAAVDDLGVRVSAPLPAQEMEGLPAGPQLE